MEGVGTVVKLPKYLPGCLSRYRGHGHCLVSCPKKCQDDDLLSSLLIDGLLAEQTTNISPCKVANAPIMEILQRQHEEIDVDRAVVLRDMARSGDDDAVNELRATSPSEEENPISTQQETDAGTRVERTPTDNATHNMHDIDHATLLGNLASYEHIPLMHAPNSNCAEQDRSHSANHFENDHFASLLQAAATAGQNQEDERPSHYDPHFRTQSHDWDHSRETFPGRRSSLPQSHKRKHSETGSTPSSDSRQIRQRKNFDTDDAQIAREREIWPDSDGEGEGEGEGEAQPAAEEPARTYTPLSPSSARAIGVHSAAALFRKPTAASKKYTRPPMSKLFTSLEISPEQFLRLQAAAKAYMLDPQHPERYHCVGSKGRVDTDMVKLKLFGCVEAFLEDEGWGQRCWGANADRESEQGQQGKNRRLRWPEGRNKIITSVTPLMRRMVTNERQRRYANETRSKEKGGKGTKTSSSNTQMQDMENVQLPPEIDPKLADYHYSLAGAEYGQTTPPSSEPQPQALTTPEASSTFRVVFVSADERNEVMHSVTLAQCTQPSYTSLLQFIRSQTPAGVGVQAVRAHLPSGLQLIQILEQWNEALKCMEQTVWMEGSMKIIVEVKLEASVDGRQN